MKRMIAKQLAAAALALSIVWLGNPALASCSHYLETAWSYEDHATGQASELDTRVKRLINVEINSSTCKALRDLHPLAKRTRENYLKASENFRKAKFQCANFYNSNPSAHNRQIIGDAEQGQANTARNADWARSVSAFISENLAKCQ